MVQDPVELVAQAFHAAECSGEWHEEPDALKEPFRDLARAAIATLNQQMAEVRSATVLPQSLHRETSTRPRPYAW
jgi:hypothetical protein